MTRSFLTPSGEDLQAPPHILASLLVSSAQCDRFLEVSFGNEELCGAMLKITESDSPEATPPPLGLCVLR